MDGLLYSRVNLRNSSIGRHSFVSQLLDGLRGLYEIGQAHAAENMRRLRELDVVVADNLDAVAPRVEEVQKSPRQDLDPGFGQRRAHGFLVIDHEPKVTPVVTGLLAAFLKGKKLVAQIDEGGMLALAAQREFEEAPVESQSPLDVAHLERDVVQSDSAGFAGLGHGGCLQMSLVENVVPTQLSGNVEIRTTRGSVRSAQGAVHKPC